jgi:hypothetical protein
MYSIGSQLTFWRNTSPPSLGSQNKHSVKVGGSFHAGSMLFLFFDPEDGGDMFLQNVGCLSTDYATLYPRS